MTRREALRRHLQKMEMEFDKEIDALLRRTGREHPDASPAGGHLDADAIAAFAENALPEAARGTHMLHLADCGRCRQVLAGSAADAAESVESISAAVPAAASAPWYRRMFMMPQLAYVMGGLVLVFSGFIGYVALRESSRPSEISAVPRAEESANRSSNLTPLSAGNSNANTAVPIADNQMLAKGPGAPTNTAVMPHQRNLNAVSNSGSTNTRTTAPAASGSQNTAAPTIREVARQNVEALPAPPAAETFATRPEAEQRAIDSRDTGATALGAPPAARAKMAPAKSAAKTASDADPSALAQHVQGAASEKRSLSGRTFERRGGVWYDTNYRGQSAKTIKRGTEDLLRMDESVRSAARLLDGTVFIVAGGKAYRIQ